MNWTGTVVTIGAVLVGAHVLGVQNVGVVETINGRTITKYIPANITSTIKR